jgi:hypothetical protein
MKHAVVFLWFISRLAFIPGSTLEAQDRLRDNPWWVNLGVGPSFVGNTFSMNGGMVYCYQFERSLISARMLGITNNNPTVQQIDKSSTVYKMADYGILYGPLWQGEEMYFSVSAGFGLVRAAYVTPGSITTNSSISMPLEVQWFWRPTRFAGIGVYAFASLNFERQLYGVLLCAQLGMW